MKKQYQFQYDMSKADDDVPLFTDCDLVPCNGPTRFHILSKHRGENVLLNLTPDIHRVIATHFTNDVQLFNHISCIGVVNGIILLQWWFLPRVVDKHLGLWNPGTREFKVVPLFNQHFSNDVLGLGFDPLLSNDFKIVAYFPTMTLNNTKTICDVYGIYSLRTNSWKRVEGPQGCIGTNTGPTIDGYLNGVYYWAAHERRTRNGGEDRYVILSFNLSTEVFRVFDPPQDALAIMVKNKCIWLVGMYKECVSVIVVSNSTDLGGQTVFCVDIWVLKKLLDHDHDYDYDYDYDCGVPMSWQHLFTIGPIHGFHFIGFLTFRMDGDLLLLVPQCSSEGEEESSGLYKPSTCTFKKLGLTFGSCFTYVESLFPLSKRLVHI